MTICSNPVEKTSSNIELTLIHPWYQRRGTWKNNHTKACGNTMTVHHGGNPDTNSSSLPAATSVNSHLTPTGTRTCSVRLVFKACSSYRKGPLGLHWGANWPSEGHSYFPILEDKRGGQTSGIVSSRGLSRIVPTPHFISSTDAGSQPVGGRQHPWSGN